MGKDAALIKLGRGYLLFGELRNNQIKTTEKLRLLSVS
jgi:hypothetical protein